MRALLAALMVLLVAACGQAPVKPAAPATPPVAATMPAPAAATPAPAAQTPPPASVSPPAPAAPEMVQEVPVDKDHRLVKIETNMGDIVLQLDGLHAPISTKNFLRYVKERYYNGSAFYRVKPGFVIQGGDFTADLTYHAPKHPGIKSETDNGLTNLRGSVGLARGDNPNSANTPFFINLVDNTQSLGSYPGHTGYTVFAHVVQGMDVVDKIAAVPTGSVTLMGPPMTTYDDVPKKAVKIIKVTLQPLASKP